MGIQLDQVKMCKTDAEQLRKALVQIACIGIDVNEAIKGLITAFGNTSTAVTELDFVIRNELGVLDEHCITNKPKQVKPYYRRGRW